jgi:hypothetical protein
VSGKPQQSLVIRISEFTLAETLSTQRIIKIYSGFRDLELASAGVTATDAAKTG